MVDHRRPPGLDPDVGVDYGLISFSSAELRGSMKVIKPEAEHIARCLLTQDLEMS